MHTFNPSSGRIETGRSLGLGHEPALPTWQAPGCGDPVSKGRWTVAEECQLKLSPPSLALVYAHVYMCVCVHTTHTWGENPSLVAQAQNGLTCLSSSCLATQPFCSLFKPCQNHFITRPSHLPRSWRSLLPQPGGSQPACLLTICPCALWVCSCPPLLQSLPGFSGWGAILFPHSKSTCHPTPLCWVLC